MTQRLRAFKKSMRACVFVSTLEKRETVELCVRDRLLLFYRALVCDTIYI